jgi:hypothetical protein
MPLDTITTTSPLCETNNHDENSNFSNKNNTSGKRNMSVIIIPFTPGTARNDKRPRNTFLTGLTCRLTLVWVLGGRDREADRQTQRGRETDRNR